MVIRRRGKKPITGAPEGYARFTEAINLFLPLSKNIFNYRVRAGDIVVKTDSSGKMYEVESILKTKNALLHHEEQKKAMINTIADWQKAEDIIASLKLDAIIYHEDIPLGEAATYQNRRKKNPHTSMAIFDAKDRSICYAYISLIPLKEEIIMDILLGRRDELDIRNDDVLTYDEPGEYTLLSTSAVHHPDHPELINKLIHAIMDYWVKQYPVKRIKRIYAQTVSDSGRLMANKLRMSKMYVVKDGQLEQINGAYILDMDEPAASKIINEFQERLKGKDK